MNQYLHPRTHQIPGSLMKSRNKAVVLRKEQKLELENITDTGLVCLKAARGMSLTVDVGGDFPTQD